MKAITQKSLAVINSMGGIDTTCTNFNSLIPTDVYSNNNEEQLVYQHNTLPDKIVSDQSKLIGYKFLDSFEKTKYYNSKYENISFIKQNEANYLKINLDPIFLARIIPNIKDKRYFLNKMRKRERFSKEESELVYLFLNFIEQAQPTNIIKWNN